MSESSRYEVWEKMTSVGKHITRFVVCDPGEVIETE